MGIEIPIIDMKKQESSKLIREACEKLGCFRVINHGVPSNLTAEIKCVAIDLFDRTVEIKQRMKEYLPGSGYIPPNPNNPVYEALALDFSSVHTISSFCDQLDASIHQREIIEKYNEFIHKLALDIANKIVGNTGLEENNDSVQVWPSHLRMNKYSITEDNIGSSALPVHTDASLITILQDDDYIGGLEIIDPSGNLVAVNRFPGGFLVNVGDIAVPWSNGKLRTLQHRVVCKDAGTRLSIATFITPAVYDQDIVAHPKFLKGDVQLKYEPFTYADFRKLRAWEKKYGGDALELLRRKN